MECFCISVAIAHWTTSFHLAGSTYPPIWKSSSAPSAPTAKVDKTITRQVVCSELENAQKSKHTFGITVDSYDTYTLGLHLHDDSGQHRRRGRGSFAPGQSIKYCLEQREEGPAPKRVQKLIRSPWVWAPEMTSERQAEQFQITKRCMALLQRQVDPKW